MNMNFEPPNEIELSLSANKSARHSPAPKFDDAGPRRFPTYLVWSAIAVGGAYGVAQASTAVLIGIGAVVVALIAFLTAVCIYAQNNTRFL
jgi:hypothetical protein